MMSRPSISILSALLLFFLIMATANSQEDMTIIDNRVFPNPQRISSIFQHDQHNEAAGIEECQECHHIYEDGKLLADESSEDQACADCHALDPSGPAPALRKAYHTNCKGCHEKNATGPFLCGECHVKP